MFLSEKDFLELLPSLKHRNRLTLLIELMAQKIVNLTMDKNKYQKKSNDNTKKLNFYGLGDHGNFNNNAISRTTIDRRVDCANKCMDALNNKVDSSIDLREKYVLKEFKANPHVFNVLKPNLESLWIEQQSILNAGFLRNSKRARKAVLLGIKTGCITNNGICNAVCFIDIFV